MKGRKDPSLSPFCSLLSIPHFLSFSYGYGPVTLSLVSPLIPFFIAADDTEYGYHSASSSSAEHHAQLGPSTSNQMVTQQQQNNLQQLQGQIQNQVSL